MAIFKIYKGREPDKIHVVNEPNTPELTEIVRGE
jgi:hypothetical protein